jgi:hypothetical protein
VAQLNRVKRLAVASAAAFLVAPTAIEMQSVPAVQHTEISLVKQVAATATLTTPAKAYTINKEFAFAANEGSNLKANNLYVVCHFVGGKSGARANASYFKNNWASSQTYVQYVVGDGGMVYQNGAPGWQAWGAGAFANANSPAQIELGYTSDYNTFKKDYAAYVALAHDMAVKYGIPLRFNDANGGIITHHFVSENWWGDHTDPDEYLSGWGVSLSTFGHDVVTGVSSLGGSSNNISNPAKSTTTTAAHSTLTTETGSFKNGDQPIQARYSPSLSGAKAGQLPAGCTVHYDGYINQDGYCWIHYTSYSGDSIYLPVHPTGSANDVWGNFSA